MKKRINTDFYVTLNVINRIDGTDYDFSNATDLTVTVQNLVYKDIDTISDLTSEKNKIKFQFTSIQNRHLGMHTVSVM